MPKAKAAERGTRIQRQRRQKLDTMFANLPSQCDIGAKETVGVTTIIGAATNSTSTSPTSVPISALLTSASVHDSQTAIPSRDRGPARPIPLQIDGLSLRRQ
ncbi:MAG: hypothetical protein HS123_13645 [Solibacteraceae bacterium]|nr:hypothetical protein [Solibacteraceae bacterium]